MLASSPTMSASGTDHTTGTNAKIRRPSPGPTEWMSVSVVYGPPDVEKKRTKTSPSVPIARGSFCFIDHASMTKRTKLHHAKSLRKSGKSFRFPDDFVETAQGFVSFFCCTISAFLWQTDLCNIVSIVILRDLCVKV